MYFTRNVRYVHMMNRMNKVAGSDLVLAVNAFADHSPAEMVRCTHLSAHNFVCSLPRFNTRACWLDAWL
jgi:hypothetical protein